MEKECITICGRKFKKCSYNTIEEEGYEYNEYYNSFKNKKQISYWYDKVLLRDDVIKTNFRGSPFNWASFIELELDGYYVCIQPPKARNGDTNWHSYQENFGFYTTLTISKIKTVELAKKRCM